MSSDSPDLENNRTSSNSKTCAICLETIVNSRLYGILENCNHTFCHSCIRQWRRSTQQNRLMCPQCRTMSHLMFPSRLWFNSEEEKKQMISNKLNEWASKPCRFYRGGRGFCRYGDYCRFKHDLDSRLASPPPCSLDNINDSLYDDFLDQHYDHVGDIDWSVFLGNQDDGTYIQCFLPSEDESMLGSFTSMLSICESTNSDENNADFSECWSNYVDDVFVTGMTDMLDECDSLHVNTSTDDITSNSPLFEVNWVYFSDTDEQNEPEDLYDGSDKDNDDNCDQTVDQCDDNDDTDNEDYDQSTNSDNNSQCVLSGDDISENDDGGYQVDDQDNLDNEVHDYDDYLSSNENSSVDLHDVDSTDSHNNLHYDNVHHLVDYYTNSDDSDQSSDVLSTPGNCSSLSSSRCTSRFSRFNTNPQYISDYSCNDESDFDNISSIGSSFEDNTTYTSDQSNSSSYSDYSHDIDYYDSDDQYCQGFSSYSNDSLILTDSDSIFSEYDVNDRRTSSFDESTANSLDLSNDTDCSSNAEIEDLVVRLNVLKCPDGNLHSERISRKHN